MNVMVRANAVSELIRAKPEKKVMDWFVDIPNEALHVVKKPLLAIDSVIAAKTLYHDLRLVTRNKKDFIFDSLKVVCPWD